ncbi:hypothetical protein C900_03889 [Fulvivirga imtechensis AK7]|uniref:Uncharacterized protein n=1 Tax=Fulvivirga imtechensis AK7 TaxID=1237149 RepID=L8JRV3_9BACT|nr:hypothetical protein [Fulvivirga imtechensis]ELR70204.1 hypothetical protein C900_03889 [Fulvivirga imtechensis AK7]
MFRFIPGFLENQYTHRLAAAGNHTTLVGGYLHYKNVVQEEEKQQAKIINQVKYNKLISDEKISPGQAKTFCWLFFAVGGGLDGIVSLILQFSEGF